MRTYVINYLACASNNVGEKAFQPFFFFPPRSAMTLSSTNYKFPNPRRLGARLKQGPLLLRLVVNCNSVESGWFVSQSSSRDCNCLWLLFPEAWSSMVLLATPRWERAFAASQKGLARGVTISRGNSGLWAHGSSIKN